MRRALGVVVAILLCGAAGYGMRLAGEWSTEVDLLPELALEETTLTLEAGIAEWTITSRSAFNADGFFEQGFTLAGELAFVELAGGLDFDPLVPEFTRMYTEAEFVFLGVGVDVGFYRGPFGDSVFHSQLEDEEIDEHPWDVEPDLDSPKEGVFSFGISADPFWFQTRFVERHSELELNTISWYDALVRVEQLPLFSGIAYDFALSLVKDAGFDHAKFTLAELVKVFELATADVEITYGVDYKEVALDWAFIDIPAVACVNVYGDIAIDPLTLDLQAFSVRGSFDERGEAFFGTAFVADRVVFEKNERYWFHYDGFEVPWDPPKDIGGPSVVAPEEWDLRYGWMLPDTSNGEENDDPPPPPDFPSELWYWLEFELVELSFCGPACCGEQYEIDIAIYWADVYEVDMYALWGDQEFEATEIGGGLFGLSRVALDASVPLMEGFSLDLGFSHSVLGIEDPTELSIGWTFTF